LNRFLRSDEGVTAIEYALIAGLIALVIVGAVTLIGTALQGPFNDVASNLP
jgi:pilus assembly protein Flp/PilA